MSGETHRATKHRWDCGAGKWVTSDTTVTIGRKFGQGEMRVAYEAVEDGVPSVIKFSTIHRTPAAQKEACLRDSRAQSVAEYYSGMFNKLDVPHKVGFVSSDALQLSNGRWANLEPRLGGSYVKHNNNAGGVVTHDATAHAFSHFTYEASHRSLLVCDIQGVGGMYTDPQILTVPGTVGQEPFGDGDLGAKGIQAFLRTHRCNDVCRRAGLKEGGGASSGGSRQQQAYHGGGGGGGRQRSPWQGGGADDVAGLLHRMNLGRGVPGGFPAGVLAGMQQQQQQQHRQQRSGGGVADAEAERRAVERALRASAEEQQLKKDQDLAWAIAESSRDVGAPTPSRHQRAGTSRSAQRPQQLDEDLARALQESEYARAAE